MASFFDIIKQRPVVYGGDEKFPLFNRISIETSSHCNRRCQFCPISTGRRDFVKFMNDATWRAIMEALKASRFDGIVSMFLLNEPLLDKSLAAKIAEVRAACPRSSIYVSTNGDPLFKGVDLATSLERVVALYDAGINTINLNVYDEGDQHERYLALINELTSKFNVEFTMHKYRHNSPCRNFIALTDMRVSRIEKNASITDMFHARGMKDVEPLKAYCMRTQRHAVVLWNGDVPICCAIDPTDAKIPVVGNVEKTPLLDLWNSEMMFKYRYFTQKKRRVLIGCRTCNHRMSYPHVVRQVTAAAPTIIRWEEEAALWE